MGIDTAWYQAVNDLARRTPGLHTVVAQYALWGGLAALALLLVGGWLRARHQPDAARRVGLAVLTGVAAVVALLVNQLVLSPLIARPRPCLTLPRVEVLLPCSADFSMPSDHTVLAGAFVAGLWLLGRALGTAAAALALLLAFSRVYVGVHYPSDTLVGLLVGAAIAVVVVLALRGPATTLAARLGDTRLSRLVRAPEPPARTTAPAGPGR